MRACEDEQAFAKEAAVDAFRDTPADQLLTGLRGKDVIFTFIESYGRSAVEDPEMAPQVDAVLADGTSRLRAAGFASRSALAHLTDGGRRQLAGPLHLPVRPVDRQPAALPHRHLERPPDPHRRLPAHRRLADGRHHAGRHRAPGRRGSSTASTRSTTPAQLGYKGPKFSWSPVPDQYTLSAFERLEHGKPDRKPLMAEIILASSHNPWAPIPRMVDWDEVGDGSVYDAIKKAGQGPQGGVEGPRQVRDRVPAFHRVLAAQPHLLRGEVRRQEHRARLPRRPPARPRSSPASNASRDVPITIVAHDPAVLDRISGWGWQDGLKPGPKAPVWRMDTFRDRFLTAYGPKPTS